MQTQLEKTGERLTYLDYLRVIATVAVVLLHVSAENWMETEVSGSAWAVFNAYNAMTRWCVPVFVMISGALFLPRKIEIQTLYKKYILRLVVVYFAWAAFYAFANPAIYKLFGKPIGFSLQSFLLGSITGSYHMWYLPMIIGMYMCLPLLQPIAQNPKRLRYFLLLAGIFAFALPQGISLLTDFGAERLLPYADALWVLESNAGLEMVLGFGSYFMAGYYLSQTELTPGKRKIIYALGVIGWCFSAGANLLLSRQINEPSQNYLGSFGIGPMLEAVAVFVWCKYHCTGGKLYGLAKKLSRYSFGVYLAHPFVLTALSLMNLHTLRFAPVLSVPLIALVITAISFGVSWMLNHIPLVKKYFV